MPLKDLPRALGALEGVHEVRDDLKQGNPQIRLRLKPQAQHLGVSASDLARQVGDAFGGLEVQRIQRNDSEVRVYIKYQKDRRRYMRDLLDTMIRTREGEWIPLSAAAALESGYTPSAVNRRNGQRIVQVTASLDKEIISPSEAYAWVQKHVTPDLLSLYPQLSIKGGGELEEMEEMQGGLKRALILILVLIYTLLAVPLKSYWQPLVIMSIIPFGFVGAVFGHRIMDFSFSILSFFGMLAAMGVVVNDSLVLMTRYNDLRFQGIPLDKALVQAGTSRFRAIVLTTVTTVCGVAPLLMESSEQAQYLIPAAISLAWGELFATPITLVLVPVMIHIQADLGAILKGLGEKMAPKKGERALLSPEPFQNAG